MRSDTGPRPVRAATSEFLMWSCQRILVIWRWHCMWKASRRRSSAASTVHVSQAYRRTGLAAVPQQGSEAEPWSEDQGCLKLSLLALGRPTKTTQFAEITVSRKMYLPILYLTELVSWTVGWPVYSLHAFDWLFSYYLHIQLKCPI